MIHTPRGRSIKYTDPLGLAAASCGSCATAGPTRTDPAPPIIPWPKAPDYDPNSLPFPGPEKHPYPLWTDPIPVGYVPALCSSVDPELHIRGSHICINWCRKNGFDDSEAIACFRNIANP